MLVLAHDFFWAAVGHVKLIDNRIAFAPWANLGIGLAAIPLTEIMWAHATVLGSSPLCTGWANMSCSCVYDGA